MADVLHHVIVFVPDLANQLFQDILQRDDASGAAVFIHDHGHMVLAFPQGAQQGGDLGHAGSV